MILEGLLFEQFESWNNVAVFEAFYPLKLSLFWCKKRIQLFNSFL